MDLVADTITPSRSASPDSHLGDESMNALLQEYVDNDDDDTMGSERNSSGPDEAVFDANADSHNQSSPDTSPHHSDADDDISEFPADSRRSSCNKNTNGTSAPVTPQKNRSPFRTPSSVRAIQLDTTPPYLVSGSRSQGHRLSTISRNSTSRSTKSFHSGARRSSPSKPKKEYPLVLLHASLLPVSCPYSPTVLETVLPSYTIQNWRLLQEKVSETVLERGILIPHPREDYDLLEERLLESLELKAPRILKCGHFHLTPEEEAEIAASEDEYDSDVDDLDICQDCGRRIRDGSFGTGSGQHRWSIKVYASNGLMRAGAWGAAWQEMERVDVEILPWLDDQMKKELDMRRDEEALHAAAQRSPSPGLDEQRRKEIYGDGAGAFEDPFVDQSPGRMPATGSMKEVPLTDLLSMYLQQVLQDRRNLAIAILSVVVVFLALGTSSSRSHTALQPVPAPEVITTAKVMEAVASAPAIEDTIPETMASVAEMSSDEPVETEEETTPQSILSV